MQLRLSKISNSKYISISIRGRWFQFLTILDNKLSDKHTKNLIILHINNN